MAFVTAQLRFYGSMPGVIYKYLKAEHVEQTMRGIFRLGTLFDFRRQESHGDEIGDVTEGTKQVTQELNGAARDILQGPNILKQVLDLPGAQFTDTSLEVCYNSSDLFVFCAAAEFDEAVMRGFKYDACVEVVRPTQFFTALDAALREQALVNRAVVSHCHYGERRRDVAVDGEIPAALVKPQEVRALWEPRGQSVEPLFVSAPEAVKHLRVCG
jgi:hypothetical protein